MKIFTRTRPMLHRWRFICDRLRRGEMMTIGALAREWEVSHKTLRRDIEYLRNEGIAIETVVGRGIILRRCECPWCGAEFTPFRRSRRN